MGLFRRGTKLLKLSGGLRDCCCRPEKPEECWCPDLCRYYWSFGGTTRLGGQDLLRDTTCVPGIDDYVERKFDPYGLATIQPVEVSEARGFSDGKFVNIAGTGVNGSPTGDCYYLLFGYTSNISGYTPQTDFTDQFPPLYAFGQQIFYQTVIDAAAYPGQAFGFPSQPPSTWGLIVDLIQDVWLIKYDFGPGVATTLYRRSVRAFVPVPAACVADSRYECDTSVVPRRLHTLSADVELTIDPENGVVLDGETYEWQSGFNTVPDVDLGHTEWHVSGEYPLTTNVTLSLKSLSSCVSAPCDCTQSLNGMIVTFEGQEFTYGQLDSFFNAGTWWEETSAGVFRRRDTESCDGSLNQTVKQATIECTQINGVDTWVCYLDHTCEERDDMTCPGPPDASRNKQWTGIFECDENGKPTGSPGSLEVDSDTTTGTPAAECVDALTVPSISISAPP